MLEVIHAKSVNVSIGPTRVFEEVTIRLAAGRTAALLGAQGTGKSVLLRTLLGRVRRSSGHLVVCGFDPEQHPREVAVRTTLVANLDVFEPHLTTVENVAHLLHLAGSSVSDRTAIVGALRDADIPDRVISARFGAQQGLVPISIWLAVAQLRSSVLLLLDDPTQFLNRADAAHLCSLICQAAERNTAVFVTTRDARFAEECASSVYSLESGRLSGTSARRSTIID